MPYKGQYGDVAQYLRDEYADYCDECEATGVEPMDWTDWYEGTEDAQLVNRNKNYQWPINGNPYY